MNLLQGKKALITGASRGIGRAIAAKFASEGADVAFTCTSEAGVASTEEFLASYGVRVRGYASDAADFDEAHRVVAEANEFLGGIDILVNNAGITRDTLMLKMKEQMWDEVLRVNLKSAFNYIHAVTPLMLRRRSGSVISMSSVVGELGNVGQANYAASKAGVIGLTKSMAKEAGGRGVRFNAIAPGFIETDMTAALTPEAREVWLKLVPLRRVGTADEVASVALFLASDLSSYLTGQVINCSGGVDL